MLDLRGFYFVILAALFEWHARGKQESYEGISECYLSKLNCFRNLHAF